MKKKKPNVFLSVVCEGGFLYSSVPWRSSRPRDLLIMQSFSEKAVLTILFYGLVPFQPSELKFRVNFDGKIFDRKIGVRCYCQSIITKFLLLQLRCIVIIKRLTEVLQSFLWWLHSGFEFWTITIICGPHKFCSLYLGLSFESECQLST